MTLLVVDREIKCPGIWNSPKTRAPSLKLSSSGSGSDDGQVVRCTSGVCQMNVK